MTIFDILKPKPDIDIQRDLDKLPLRKKFSSILYKKLEKRLEKDKYEILDLNKSLCLINAIISEMDTNGLNISVQTDSKANKIQIYIGDKSSEVMIIDVNFF